MLAFFFSMRVFNDGAPGWKNIITSDGRGYYAYLPALLIDHDPTFSEVVKKEARLLKYPHYKPGYLVKSGDHFLNKYFAGEALLLLPFFLLGTLCSFIAGTNVDGYSFFFQFFIGLGSLFYLFSGFAFLKKILEFFQIRPIIISITLVAILIGTNLFYYSLWQPTMSHVFSFFAINGFLWFTINAIKIWDTKTASWMGVFLGLVCLIRPTNIIVVLLVPFLTESNHHFIQFFRDILAKKITLIIFLLIIIAIVFIQPLLWYLQTGHLFLWSYSDEGFNFSDPQIMNVLFSYRKGLFIYTPLILLSLFGLFPLVFGKRIQFFSVALFLVSGTYLIASWWNWYYGDGFGLRAFIDYYGIFAILLAIFMNRFRPGLAVFGMALFLTPFVLLNLVQTWQYSHLVILPNSMNANKYHHIFMRTDSAVMNCLGGNEEIANYNINLNNPVSMFATDFEKQADGWSSNTIIKTSRAFSKLQSGYLDSLHPFSPGIAVKAGQLCRLPAELHVTGEIMVWDSLPGASNDALVVLSMDSIQPGENYWRGFRLNDVPVKTSKSWRKCRFSLMLPEISNPDRILKVYIWNTGRKPMLVDDFTVRFFGR
jgi:hypothetical protein